MIVFEEQTHPAAKPVFIKEWVISRLKKGYTPSQIVIDAQRLQNMSVSKMAVSRWRKRYIAVTGEYIPNCYEFKKSLKKKIQPKDSN